MGEVLTSPDVVKIQWLIGISKNLSPSDKKKYEYAKINYKGNNIVQFMEDYFRKHGFIAD